MKQKIGFLFLCLALILPGISSAQQKKKVKTAELIEVAGTILNSDGTPVQGAKISSAEGAILTTTNAQGEYKIKAGTDDFLLIELKGHSSQRIAVPNAVGESIAMVALPYQMTEDDKVNIPFAKMDRRLIPGAVTVLDADEIVQYDTRQGVYSALNGRVVGSFGNLDVRGLGNATVIVDGIPRPADVLNLLEIDQITVLRDLSSRMFYGAQANQGVIMVTTKRGQPYKRRLGVIAESGFSTPISYPNYLDAASYMELYNEALSNDGLPALYTQSSIDNTRNGVDPLLYPDENYFDPSYFRSNAPFYRVMAESGGGNESAQYYLNLGWDRNTSLLNIGEATNQTSDRLNLRGNVDYKLNDWLSMNLDAVAQFNFGNNPRYSGTDYWGLATTILPNEFPLLIPADKLTDPTLRGTAVLVNGGNVLGGTSEFKSNIFGELLRNGYNNTASRILQINSGLNFDLGNIVEGLSARTYLSFDFYNIFNTVQNNSYAIYEPITLVASNGSDSLAFKRIGQDTKVDDQGVGGVGFYRRLGFYGTVDYTKQMGNNRLQASALAYNDQQSLQSVLQPTKNLHFGLRANYSIANKYIAELTGIFAGSPLFSEDNRYAFSPAVSLAWIASEEGFLQNSSAVNFLKFRANFGLNNTDDGINSFYLYQTAFNNSTTFNYNHGTGKNQSRSISAGNPDLGWVKRAEVNVGFESVLFDNWNLEVGYFNSRSFDNLTIRSGAYPSIVGPAVPFENYNAFTDSGVEWGLGYSKEQGDFGFSVGLNGIYAVPTASQIDEPDYGFDYRQREGKDSDARFGWVALGLFQSQDEINNSPKQSFGDVKPGDIKYQDLNGDNVIDENDQQVIGNNQARLQLGGQLRVRYKNLEFFALGTGQSGSEALYNNPYFWVFGNRKYSSEVQNRWTPETAASATYPRLSTTNSPNNFRTSTFWQVENNFFTLHAAQLSYSVPFQDTFIKNLKVFVRGNNLFTISDNRERRELNIGSAPQTRAYALGVTGSF